MLISTHTLTQTQCISSTINSPPKVENGSGRECGKAVFISTDILTHKHNAFLHTSHSKVENGSGRDRGKAVLISTHTLTHKLNVLLHNSPSKLRMQGSRKDSVHLHHIVHTQTMHFSRTHRLKWRMDQARNAERQCTNNY